MRIIIILLSCILLSSSHLVAKNFHLILVSSTDDETIGDGCQANIFRLKDQFQPIAKSINLRFQYHQLTGSQVASDSIFNLIEKIQFHKTDIVVFHYSGHGTNRGSNTQWPKFLIPGSKKKAYLTKIHQKILAKHPRFLLTLSDCCNGQVFNRNRIGIRNISDASLTKREIANYRKLFKEANGDILAAACQKGKVAYYDMYIGGFFTLGFCEALRNEANNNSRRPVSWESVFRQTEKNTDEIANGWQRKQIPIYKIQTKRKQQHPVFGDVIIKKHRIKKGETLNGIARKYKVSVKNIKVWNQLKSNLIYAGNMLIIKQ